MSRSAEWGSGGFFLESLKLPFFYFIYFLLAAIGSRLPNREVSIQSRLSSPVAVHFFSILESLTVVHFQGES